MTFILHAAIAIFAMLGFSVSFALLVAYLTDLWYRLAARRYHRPRLETRGEKVQMVHPQLPRAVGYERRRQAIPKLESTGALVAMARRLS